VSVREISTLLLVDPIPGCRESLARALRVTGREVWIAEDAVTARHVLETRRPELVATELKLEHGGWRDVHAACQLYGPPTARTVILTAQGSIATAVSAMKAGVAHYLIKPASAEQLLRAGDGQLHAAAPCPSLSLDRAIWELLVQAVECHGSIAQAARMLRVDRRSLRRMLQKMPPLV
jgi:two-component system response regulator RegA